MSILSCVATSDQPAMLRMKCRPVATTIAECLGIRGRCAADDGFSYQMAWHKRGDRSCCWETAYSQEFIHLLFMQNFQGCKWGFCKVPLPGFIYGTGGGDDTNDAVRGILDGHILSRQLAEMPNHFPAIDISAVYSTYYQILQQEEPQESSFKVQEHVKSLSEKCRPNLYLALTKGNSALDEAVDHTSELNKFLE